MTAAVAPGASNTAIVTIIELGDDAAEYNRRVTEVWDQRPAECPACLARHIVGHGWYPRWAVYLEMDAPLAGIKRWRCKGCGKTISLLPSFLHRHRHYALRPIEDVLRGHAEQGVPLTQLVPSERSVRRWWAAFASCALRWLSAVLSALALALPLLRVLDPHGGEASDGPAQLLARSHDLASWLEPDNADSLRVLWRWGWNAGIGRLV